MTKSKKLRIFIMKRRKGIFISEKKIIVYLRPDQELLSRQHHQVQSLRYSNSCTCRISDTHTPSPLPCTSPGCVPCVYRHTRDTPYRRRPNTPPSRQYVLIVLWFHRSPYKLNKTKIKD